MINLMIVDDEETTRDSLMELVPWTEWGINAVKSAENGLTALKLAEGFPPSILLTDIRMPKMNGIELSKKIRQLFPDCIIIFLSGFSDKEYLKSAIQLNAVDYLEKPVDLDELKALFLKTIQKLVEDGQKSLEDEHFRSSYIQNIHLLRQEITLDLICNSADLDQSLSKYGIDTMRLSSNGVFTVVCVMFNWKIGIANDERVLMKHQILKKLNHEAYFTEFPFIAGFVNDNYLILIVNEDLNSHRPLSRIFGENLLRMLQADSSNLYTLSIGISNPTLDANALPGLFKTSLEIVKQQFYYGVNQLFFPNSLAFTSYEIDEALYSRFKKLIRNQAADEAIDLIRVLTKDIEAAYDPYSNKIKNFYFNFMRILYEVIMQWEIVESRDSNETIYMWQEINERITLKELSAFLIANIEIVLSKTVNKENTTSKIDEIKKYITNNYSSNQLSIQYIAEYSALTQTYLCAYFKKSTGKTINEYITELRIEKAKELLIESSAKLYDITTGIGLTDTNYFSTLFKKYMGLTPSEFREKHLYDKKTL